MSGPTARMMTLVREMVSIAATDWTEAETDEFLDAISPSLRRRLLIEQMAGYGSKIAIDPGVKSIDRQKINAIKYVRAATGWGLKETKEFVETAEGYNNAYHTQLPSDMSTDLRWNLGQNLRGTGYKLV